MVWHAITRYQAADGARQALVLKDGAGEVLYDMEAVATALGADTALTPVASGGVLAWLAKLSSTGPALAELAGRASAAASALTRLDGVKVLAPYLPTRIFAAASNYHEHAREMGTQLAERTELQPYFFMKADSAVIGPGDTVVIPPQTEKADWEVELAAVIGTGGRDIPVEGALAHVAGYTILNDVSARDLNRRTDYPFKHDWFRGKSWDTFAPLGPYVVPAGCIADPQALRLRLAVNETMMQDGTSSEMIFSIAEQIAYLSTILTLRAGDLIATGTPTGVGMGRGIFLKAGDVMTASIESIGTLRNPVA
jgi:2-keto-4-pentenoate hydratase/2-oxohepta-3-ene-1,7-dioic acid hydratase in catechol pathway